ncbi:MAG TPA: diguanylate cyclase [Thiobacillaceae bacterium]|nr:diguanylate cyclase [Thiobacillaceae bacterium]
MSLQRNTSLYLTCGTFMILMGLIVAQAIHGVMQLRRIQQNMENVVALHEHKIDIVTRTQVAAHMRADRLYRMVLEKDPFEQDALWMEFLRAGYLVGSGRNQLKDLGFSPEEQAEFNAQSELIRNIEPAQEQVVNLLKANRRAEAEALMIKDIIPLQQSFNEHLAILRSIYQEANLASLHGARETYRRNLLLTISAGLIAVMLGTIIGILTLKQLASQQRRIRQQVDELERSREALEEEATHDPLTGLANRRLFYDRLQQGVRHAKRYRSNLGILFLDMDRFKEINDRHGHHVGDAVLTEVAKRIVNSVRESDTVARLGGDEFAVLLENVGGRNDCMSAALKIEEALGMGASFYGLELELSASIGQALYPDDGQEEDELIRAADAAMYRVKHGELSRRQQRFLFGN